MKAYLTWFILVTFSFGIYGKFPAGTYYQKALTKFEDGMSVKQALHGAINKQKVLSYKEARRHLFGRLHLDQTPDGSYLVRDVYCHQKVGQSDGVGPYRIPDTTVINCEHTWPQSRFNGRLSRSAQKTDLHHLYPADSRANSSRGNLIFAEVAGREAHGRCSSSQRGQDVMSMATAFEPPLEHRGNVARALFYFSTRYQLKISQAEERHLRRWHQDDPVDSHERWRNEEIYKLQGNRNPFIDEPSAVDDIADF